MTIEQRVAKLEKQNRWMRRGGGVMLAAVACVVLMGQGKERPRFVEAQRFTLVNADGETRALLESDDEQDCPSLTLFDDKGTKRIVLSVAPGGHSALHLFGRKRVRAGLGVGGDAGPADLALVDKDDNLRVQLYAWKKESPGLVLRDQDQRVRVRIYGEENARIELAGKDGKVIWQAPPK